MIIFLAIGTGWLLIKSYEMLIMNKSPRDGSNPYLYFIDASFYMNYLLTKKSPLNVIYFGSKCNCLRPHIRICCQCFIALCGLFLVSIISLVLYYIYDKSNIYLYLNLGLSICALFTIAFFQDYVRKLVKKYRKEEEAMSEEEWLAIRKEIEEEWPGFWDEQQ